jgi:hypothetical protein
VDVGCLKGPKKVETRQRWQVLRRFETVSCEYPSSSQVPDSREAVDLVQREGGVGEEHMRRQIGPPGKRKFENVNLTIQMRVRVAEGWFG